MANLDPLEIGDLLASGPDDPPLSIHLLSEFAFCRRAGLCLYEQGGEDEQRDEVVSTTYLPIYERVELEQMLKAYSTEFWGWCLAGLTGATVCGAIALASGYRMFWIGAVVVALLAMIAAIDPLKWAWRASEYVNAWNEATPQRPDPESPRIEEISWCALRASGFEAHDVPAAYSYDLWAIGGRPWKVLEYGNLRIPVFKYPKQWKGLFPQHFVRMTGYCELLERCTGYQSPYGVIVRSGSLMATIVPKTGRSVAAFAKTVQQARETIIAAREMNVFPPPPRNLSFCSNCRWGEPQIHRRGTRFLRDGRPIEPRLVPVSNRRNVHSHCGDRFQWLPPHKKAGGIGLQA